jgi:cell division protein FtsB
MTQSSARTLSASSGQRRASVERRTSRAARERAAKSARRRWLILAATVLIVVAAILANVKPLTHFQDASARLDKATTKVSALRAQKDELQNRLAKLGEPAYLETLAREQLTYAKPGEDLYIITPNPEGDGTATLTPTDGAQPLSAGAANTSTAGASGGAANDHPGVFERILNAIRGVF